MRLALPRAQFVPPCRLGLQMADDRNLPVHTYNQSVAEAIFAHIPAYVRFMDDLLSAMRKQAS